MRSSARVVTAVLGAGAGLVLVAPAALAQTVQDEYSGVASDTATRSSTSSGVAGSVSARTAPSTLPFTGAEVSLAAAAGAGALLTGVALVAAGRRRNATDESA
ncbi:MAG: hypothetical protein JWN88_3206 [Frankiales bacterium]|jgi:LPXTG-motif cell wall-anchored protein|nr:hypothetical protein [Frankiales bacterium]